MARLDEAVYARLQAVSGVTALVATRVYPSLLPQKPVYPCLRYQEVDGQRESAMGSDLGQVSATLQVDAYAATYAGSRALAEQVRLALQRFRGTVASVEIEDVFVSSGPNDFYEDQVKAYRTQMDFLIWHRE